MWVMQSKRIVFQRSSAACGNRVVKRVWMTEACTLVSLLIVVRCLHAFGPHTTAMAWGSFTANPWVSAFCWKGALSHSPTGVKELWVCVLFMDGYTRLASPPPPRLSACVCAVMCVYAHMQEDQECYNNKLGSSVTLNSPTFQEESKQNWLLLCICTYYKCMEVSRALPTRTLNPESKSLMEV